jgi:hypothetical protein
MLRTTIMLLALALSLQVTRAAAAQDGDSLSERIADTIKVYEANWVLETSKTHPYSEMLKYRALFFDWKYEKYYVTAEVLLHSTEEDAALTLKNANIKERRKGEVSPSNVRGLGDDAYEWKGAGVYYEDCGYYFRKGKAVVLINSSSKLVAKRFAMLIAKQL